MKFIILLIPSILFSHFVFSQNNYLSKGDSLFQLGNIKASIVAYKVELNKTDDRFIRSELNYRIAESYKSILKFDIALQYYHESYRDDREYKDIFWDIAVTLKSMGRYNEALKYFKKCRKHEVMLIHVNSEINYFDQIISVIQDTINIDIELVKSLSTPYSDFSPYLFDDDKILLTSSRIFHDSLIAVGRRFNLFVSEQNNFVWKQPTVFGGEINDSNNIGTVSIDNERGLLFFTKCYFISKDSSRCDIFYTYLNGGLVGESHKLNIDKSETSEVNGHPAYSNMLKTLVFVSDMEGGYGGKDLWAINYNTENDTWSDPVNLGPEINTISDEMFPFVAMDGTLYFSSNGGVNVGGMDIFKAEINSTGQWIDRTNLGVPINSAGDDFGLVLNKSMSSGYFTSNRKGGLGFDDIYQFKASTEKEITNGKYKSLSNIEEVLTKITENTDCNESKPDLSTYKVYPNPTAGEINFQFESDVRGNVEVRIFDPKGEVFFLKSISINSGLIQQKINLEKAPSGVLYFQVLKGCEILMTEKIIKI